LPIQGWGNVATGALPNRQRYQGNEYREEAGLNWMDFHNRQYDPQLGRFLGIDALADVGGQQMLSPYQAMGCNPALMVDPIGLSSSVTALPGVVVIGNRLINKLGGNFVANGAAFLFEGSPWTADSRTPFDDTRDLLDRAIEQTTGGQSNDGDTDKKPIETVGRKTRAQLQTGDYDCVYECFSMLMKQFGSTVFFEDIKKFATSVGIATENGVSPDDIEKLGKMLGFDIYALNPNYNVRNAKNEELVWNTLANGGSSIFVIANSSNTTHAMVVSHMEKWKTESGTTTITHINNPDYTQPNPGRSRVGPAFYRDSYIRIFGVRSYVPIPLNLLNIRLR
ncbi:MAG: hypothetical protein EOO88_62790, partial [Pedobacter sp.]